MRPPGSCAAEPMTARPLPTAQARAAPVIYYQDPDGKPFYSAEPRTTPDGRPCARSLPARTSASMTRPTYGGQHADAAEDPLLPQSDGAAGHLEGARRRTRWGWITSPSMRARMTTEHRQAIAGKLQRSASRPSRPPAGDRRPVRAPGTIQSMSGASPSSRFARGLIEPSRTSPPAAKSARASRCSGSTARRSRPPARNTCRCLAGRPRSSRRASACELRGAAASLLHEIEPHPAGAARPSPGLRRATASCSSAMSSRACG